MCDIEKIKTFKDEAMNMDLGSFRQLMLDADTEEDRAFYVSIYNHIIQTRQSQLIKEHVF